MGFRPDGKSPYSADLLVNAARTGQTRQKTPQEILEDIRSFEAVMKNTPPSVPELKIMCNDMLPPGTMMVAPDVFEMLKQLPRKGD